MKLNVESVVAQTMNILEKEYGVEELENFGMPTVYEITELIEDEWSEQQRSATKIKGGPGPYNDPSCS